MKWFAVVFMAGTAMAGSAFAGPVMGPWGIWNNGGAYGSFGPYQRGCGVGDRVVLREAPRRSLFGHAFGTNEALAPVAENVTIEKRNLGKKHLVETKQIFTETRIIENRPRRTLWKESDCGPYSSGYRNY